MREKCDRTAPIARLAPTAASSKVAEDLAREELEIPRSERGELKGRLGGGGRGQGKGERWGWVGLRGRASGKEWGEKAWLPSCSGA